jgi:hypothetical protein
MVTIFVERNRDMIDGEFELEKQRRAIGRIKKETFKEIKPITIAADTARSIPSGVLNVPGRCWSGGPNRQLLERSV